MISLIDRQGTGPEGNCIHSKAKLSVKGALIMNKEIIKASNLSLVYKDGTKALNDINIEINPGDLVYITGPSGSGKTSFLKLLMGIEYPTGGSLNVLGVDIKRGRHGRIQKMRRQIGPIFQEFRLIEGRTALENVCMGMRFFGVSPSRIRQQAMEALIRVGLESKIHTKVENLSWGQAQRVAIARAVVRKPKLLLADEPTGNLDQDNAISMLQLLGSFCDNDTAVVITTHATHLIENRENAIYVHVNKGEFSISTGKAGMAAIS